VSRLPSLEAVLPVYDEHDHVETTLTALRAALDRSPWGDAAVIVVDDGSRDGTGELLDRLAPALRLTVLHQANAGRLAARTAGLLASSAELALLVDARVTVHPDALAHLADELRADPTALIWNGDVTVDTRGNVFAAFWSALTVLGWRRYFARRRRMSYGFAEFDHYPKGTGFFVAPRDWLIEESARLRSHFADRRFSSDDTALIRQLVLRADIHLSPRFSCTYTGRDELGPFLRHALYRGTTFVDSYVGRPGPVGRATGLALATTPAAVLVASRHRRAAGMGAVAAALGLGCAARASGATSRDAVALAGLSPLFGVVFGAGVVRGLLLAARALARPSR